MIRPIDYCCIKHSWNLAFSRFNLIDLLRNSEPLAKGSVAIDVALEPTQTAW